MLTLASTSLFLKLDLIPLLAITLAALSCTLLGNFLVLRRQSLMGDAISHSVLPGLVGAFLLTQSRSPGVMFLGAAAAAAITALLIELVKRLGKVEPGAAMGVVFSVLFALGVLLIERAQGLENVDLDPGCVLYGQPEYLTWWDAPETLAGLLDLSVWGSAPTPVFTLTFVAIGAVLLVTVLFKELRIASFDPALATTQGIHAGAVHVVLMLAVAAATVASFEAVGSILVIAMLITPASTARLLTDRLSTQLWLSSVLAVVSSIGGYVLAASAPMIFGIDHALNAAGTITVVSALVLFVTIFLSPSQGLLARGVRHRRLASQIAVEDLLGRLYRVWEQSSPASGRSHTPVAPDAPDAPHAPHASSPRVSRRAVVVASRMGLVTGEGVELGLTEKGLDRARDVIRRHRDWQGYLVDQAGLRPDHAHDQAHQLEHLPPVSERD